MTTKLIADHWVDLANYVHFGGRLNLCVEDEGETKCFQNKINKQS